MLIELVATTWDHVLGSCLGITSWDHADCPQPFQMNYFVIIVMLFRKHLLRHESCHVCFQQLLYFYIPYIIVHHFIYSVCIYTCFNVLLHCQYICIYNIVETCVYKYVGVCFIIVRTLYCFTFMLYAIMYCTVNTSTYYFLLYYVHTHIYIIIHLPLIYFSIVIV